MRKPANLRKPAKPLRRFQAAETKGRKAKPANLRRKHRGLPLESSATTPKARRLLRLYEDDLHVRFATRTVETYAAHVLSLLEWLGERGVQLHETRTADLEQYQASLLAWRQEDGRAYASETLSCRLRAVKNLFRFLYRHGYTLGDPAAPLPLPRRDQRLPRAVLTRDEVARALATPRGDEPRTLRDRAVMETLYGTGIRVSELINLQLDDVDTDERVLRVVLGKGGKDRNLPLTATAAEAIDAYLLRARPQMARQMSGSVLFLGGYGRKLTRGTVSAMLVRCGKDAKLRKRLTAHVFRHSFATHLLQGHADIRHIQVMLGHKCLSSTERYTRVTVGDLRKVIERAHPRGR